MASFFFVQQLTLLQSSRQFSVSSNFVTGDDVVNLVWVDHIATPSVRFQKPTLSTQQQ